MKYTYSNMSTETLIFVITRRRRMDVDLALSVRLFVRPGVTHLLGHALNTITDLNMKPQGCIDLIQEKCAAQEP